MSNHNKIKREAFDFMERYFLPIDTSCSMSTIMEKISRFGIRG